VREVVDGAAKVVGFQWSAVDSPERFSVAKYLGKLMKIMKSKKNAKKSGKLLAHALVEDDFFKGRTVSLIGFSMGTEVIVS